MFYSCPENHLLDHVRWVWLLTVVVSQNVTGGTLATIMVIHLHHHHNVHYYDHSHNHGDVQNHHNHHHQVTYSFIADNSTESQRTLRLSVLSFAWHVASPAAGFICVFVYLYICIFVFVYLHSCVCA